MNLDRPAPAPSGFSAADGIALMIRLGLGLLFIYLGFNKALQPVDFLKLVRQYHLIETPLLLNLVAAGLPWFEVFCGLLLVAGVAVRGSALMLILMLVPFTAAVLHRALALHTALAIPFCAVKFDCGCGTGEVYVCRKLVENSLLLALAAWLLTGRGRRFSLRYQLFKSKAAAGV